MPQTDVYVRPEHICTTLPNSAYIYKHLPRTPGDPRICTLRPRVVWSTSRKSIAAHSMLLYIIYNFRSREMKVIVNQLARARTTASTATPALSAAECGAGADSRAHAAEGIVYTLDGAAFM